MVQLRNKDCQEVLQRVLAPKSNKLYSLRQWENFTVFDVII